MEFAKESDRAAVILGAAKLDIQLYQLLRMALRPATGNNDELFDGDAPLSTFSSRIHLCHRLGLIDDEFSRALHLVRRIRNSFAHEISSTTLESGGNRDRVHELALPFTRHHDWFTEMRNHIASNHKGASADFRTAIAFLGTQLFYAIETGKPIYGKDPMPLVATAMIQESFRPSTTKT
jgi:hypothetical protein